MFDVARFTARNAHRPAANDVDLAALTHSPTTFVHNLGNASGA
jgi:hypothetical protein